MLPKFSPFCPWFQTRIIRLGGIALFLALIAAFITTFGAGLVMAQVPQPIAGWTVCEDLGIGPVSGRPGEVQRVRLCTGNGWEIDAYCVEPEKPVPPLGTLCSMTSAVDIWCGDLYQLLRQYQVVAVPQPPTPTFTPTFTFTPTATATATPLPVPNTGSSGAANRQPASVEAGAAGGAASTPFVRPAPGGPTNRNLVLGLASILGGVISLGAAAAIYAGRLRRFG